MYGTPNEFSENEPQQGAILHGATSSGNGHTEGPAPPANTTVSGHASLTAHHPSVAMLMQFMQVSMQQQWAAQEKSWLPKRRVGFPREELASQEGVPRRRVGCPREEWATQEKSGLGADTDEKSEEDQPDTRSSRRKARAIFISTHQRQPSIGS